MVTFYRQPPAPPLLALATSTVALAVLPGGDANALLCGLALAASLIAALDCRSQAMVVLIGVAIGLAPGGLILSPIIVGLAIRRRGGRFLLLAPIVGIGTCWATGGWDPRATLPNLFTVAHPDLIALIAATGAGVAAWVAAETVSRALCPRQMLATAGLGALAMALFVPTAAATLILPMLVVVGTRFVGDRTGQAANDNLSIPRFRLAA